MPLTRFVLVDTSHAGNVGAAARAIKVMGFSDLVLVRPRFVDITDHDDAVALVRRIRDQGSTVVFVEHVMRAVMALTDRVVVFDQGMLLAEGPAAEVMQRPEVMTAYLGVVHEPGRERGPEQRNA